jgi:hypothetical protein
MVILSYATFIPDERRVVYIKSYILKRARVAYDKFISRGLTFIHRAVTTKMIVTWAACSHVIENNTILIYYCTFHLICNAVNTDALLDASKEGVREESTKKSKFSVRSCLVTRLQDKIIVQM